MAASQIKPASTLSFFSDPIRYTKDNRYTIVTAVTALVAATAVAYFALIGLNAVVHPRSVATLVLFGVDTTARPSPTIISGHSTTLFTNPSCVIKKVLTLNGIWKITNNTCPSSMDVPREVVDLLSQF